jgi:catechol 2,3-dioxygenase-like lactoylglutathione lyase family enzyme
MHFRLLSALATVVFAAAVPAQEPLLKLQSFTVIVRDYDDALRWYRDKLGFAVIRDQSFGQGQRFVMVAPTSKSETAIVLEHLKGGGPAMTSGYGDRVGKEVNIVLRSDDVSATYEALKARGVEFDAAPHQQPWGGEALFHDLYGNTFVVVGPLKRAPAKPSAP